MKHLITVVGTIFMDIKGFAIKDYNPVGRNLGNIQFIHGGVGRNIAENLARMDGQVSLVSSVDDAGTGHEVIERLQSTGVDTSYIQKAEQQGMGMWLAILNEQGDLAGSISQMPDLSYLQRAIFEQGEAIVQRSTHIALEIDLSEEVSERVIQLAHQHQKPVYGIPGNMDVVLRRPDFFKGMECFICNDIEATQLMGVEVLQLEPEVLLKKLTLYVESTGLRSMVITLGAQGCVYYDSRSGSTGHQNVFPVQVVDTTGAGDAFFSGTVMGLVRELPLSQAVIYGTKTAGWTIESLESNCQNLDKRIVQDELLQQMLSSVTY